MSARDGRLIPLTRIAFTPLGIFTAIFGPLLLLFPAATDRYWAWPIQPEMSAAWVGAGYTFGAIAITLLLARGRVEKLFVPLSATWVFSCAMLLATVLHWDRFFTGRPQFWIWFAIYVFLPFGLPVTYWLNRRRALPHRADELRFSGSIAAVGAVAAIVFGALGLLMFLSPVSAAGFWPWRLTPLMSRVIGGWLLFLATGSLCLLFERRYAAYREYIPAAGIWFILLLAAAVRNTANFDFSRPAAYIFFGVLIVLIALLWFAAYYFERKYRA